MNGVKIVDYPADKSVYNERPHGLQSLMGGGIVLHHTGGRDSRAFLKKGHGVSTHKLFAKNGTIYKMVSDRHRAWHAGDSAWGGREDWNDFSLGYEIENMGNGKDPYTDMQYEAVAQSIAYDTALYHIEDKWVRRHAEVGLPRGRKTDTSANFDLKRLWARVAEIRANWPLEEWRIPLWFKANR